jgi:hypothetical protein
MLQRHRPRPSWTLGAELLLLLALLASGIPASADLRDGLPPEEPDDPPGVPARAPTGATIAAAISFGRFTHVQVNVNGAGANVPGDAANEPSIAVDPTNHDRMVIGWRQFDTIASNFREAGVGYSTDGGATWKAGKINPFVFRSDPVLGVDATGKFFYNSLLGNLTTQVFPSVDGGATWGASTYAYGGDKQWMAIDQTGGASDGFIHQAWSPAGNPNPSQTYNRSIDGGASYSAPSTLAPFPLFWGTLDVASDGTLYVVGTEGSANLVAKSVNAKNGAVTPTFTYSFVNLGGLMFPPGAPNSPNPAGLLGQLWIGVDKSNGPRAGWIYVLASIVTANDPLDVMFARSTDGGQTWSAPVRVNDDPAGNGAWQWFSTMSVAPDGRIEAVWNDSRTTGTSTMTALFYSYSHDGGVTWSTNEQVSPVWNSLVGFPNQAKIGDYYHMVSDDEGADLAWSATFNGGQDVYYVRIPRQNPVAVNPETQRRFALHPGQPNPFRTSTTLRFEVPPSGGDVKLEVVDVGGRRVTTLEERWLPGGTHAARWDGGDAAGGAVTPGVYLCRLAVDGAIQTRRLLRVQ